MKLRKKSVAAVLAVTMALFCIIGGTLAWLTAETGQVENVFTIGNINLTLNETSNVAGQTTSMGNTYKMIPGNVLAKDPKVTVEAGSEACWLFVKVDESIKSDLSFDDYLTYQVNIDQGEWTALGTDYPGVYYRQVAATTEDTPFYVLAGDTTHPYGKVTVKDTVTQKMMEELGDNSANYPKLTFTAYAVQSDNIATAAEAWGKLPGNTPDSENNN